MSERGAALSLRPLPQPALEEEGPDAPDDTPADRDWFHDGVPAPARRSPWKGGPRVGMK